MLSILYLTDNSLPIAIFEKVKDELIHASHGRPIVSVSQKPIHLGINVCIGETGRSWRWLYTQIMRGLSEVETEFVAIAEHDCLYVPEHFEFIPKDDKFYYNKNHWLVQWETGEYSFFPNRKAMSQLICTTKKLKRFVQEMINLLSEGMEIKKGYRWYGEPGLGADRYQEYCSRSNLPEKLKIKLLRNMNQYQSDFFETNHSNLDIQHNNNFTQKKTGKNICQELPYWGKFSEVINA